MEASCLVVSTLVARRKVVQWMNNLLDISSKCENISAAEAGMTVSGIWEYLARSFFTSRS